MSNQSEPRLVRVKDFDPKTQERQLVYSDKWTDQPLISNVIEEDVKSSTGGIWLTVRNKPLSLAEWLSGLTASRYLTWPVIAEELIAAGYATEYPSK